MGKKLNLPEDEICKLYDGGTSAVDIGIKYSCSSTCIYGILNRNNIDRRSLIECQGYIDLPDDEICDLYLDGVGAVEISNKYNCSSTRIYRILKTNDIKRRPNITLCGLDLDDEMICSLYLDGMCAEDIAIICNCSQPTIYHRLRINNIEIRTCSEHRIRSDLPEVEICNLYNNEICISQLCIIYQCSSTSIKRILNKYNIVVRTLSEVRNTFEVRKRISAGQQHIPYNEWESFAKDSPYCPLFNEECRESNREKYDRRCFLSGLPESENITKTGKHRKLSVHHVDMNKQQGCDGRRWKLVPLCMKCHGSAHSDLWEARITWLLENVWCDEYYEY